MRFLPVAVLLMSAHFASADQWNKLTRLEVSETVQVPGATLTPGEYVVKLADSPSNRNIVRFMNADQTKVIATVLAIPNQRLQPTGDTELAWYETPAGEPPALRAWFYPGDNFGQQFVYSGKQAREIAGKSKRNVPTMDEDSARFLSSDTRPDSPPPAFDANRRVYSSGADGRQRTLDEGFTEDERLDREDPKWRDRQKSYSRYGRFGKSENEGERTRQK